MSTPKILTWLHTSKPNSNGQYPIWIRITYKGDRAELSTGVYVDKEKYKGGDTPIRGSKEEAGQNNLLIANIRTQLLTAYNKLIAKGEDISARKIKESYLGADKTSHGLIDTFEYHNNRIKDLIPQGDYSPETLELFQIQKDQFQEFISSHYSLKDMDISKVDFRFLNDLEYWLKQSKGNANNTVRKKFQRLNKVLKFAMNNQWIDRNPLDNHKIKEKEKEIVFLSNDELQKIETTNLTKQSLVSTRDRFLFSCYTGLAYKELTELTWDQVTKDINGNLRLVVKRHKTHKTFNVPLLSPAIKILDKYKTNPVAIADGKCFPKISNQQYNGQLKDLAKEAKVKKSISTHTARRTFATWGLTNGLTMETVSHVLGHASLKITQKYYAQITDEKVLKEMTELDNRISNGGKSA